MNALFALETLLRASLWGALAIGVAWLLCFAGRNHLGAGVRAWIWRLALLKMMLGLAPLSPIALSLLPPVEKAPQSQNLAVAAPHREIAPNFDSFPTAENQETAPALPEAPVLTAPPKPPQRAIPVAPIEPPPSAPPFRPNWPLIALSFWAFGASFQTIQLARGYALARTLRRASTPLQNEPVASVLAEVCARLGVRDVLRLALSTAGPLLLGARNPLILLPEPLWRAWNETELRLVLAHEIAHHKRADLKWNFLLGAAQIFFWFHPLLWIARREWRACCEQACDELTLHSTRESAALYGALLLRLATQNASNGPAMVGVSEFALLKRRLMEMKLSNSRPTWPRPVVAAAILAGAASLLPWQLTARAQTEAPSARKSALEGILRDTRGLIVASADIFVLGARNETAFLHTDSNGHYELSGPSLVIPATDLLYVQGQSEGFARFNLRSSKGKFGFSALQWLPTSVPKLSFVDEANRPIANREMRVWSVGKASDLRRLPPLLSQRFSARTDARGQISFPALPQGLTMQLESGDTNWVETVFGLPDRRGTRFARLGKEDLISLQGAETRRTIRLLKPATLSGQVKASDSAQGAPGVVVFARYLGAKSSRAKVVRGGNIASVRTDAQGRYQMNGLRPGQYQLEISPDSTEPARLIRRENRSRPGAFSLEVSRGEVTPSFARQESQKTLKSGSNQVNFQIRASKTAGKSGTRTVSGRVVGPNGAPVAGATVYLMGSFRNGDKPTATIKTDAQGHFSLRDPRSVPAADLARNFQWGQLFVDAGTRGMAFHEVISIGAAQVEVQLLPTATPRLTFVDVQNRPVVNAGVRLWKVGTKSTYWLPLPDVFLKRFVGRTNARGEVVFPSLPQGLIAQFMLSDEKQVPGNFRLGEVRGGRFAPLSTEDFVVLNAPIVRKTIQLLPVANLNGVVKAGKSGVPLGNLPVVARRINAAEARGDIANRDSRMASTRSNAQGVYRLDGLRPGNYYVWAYPTNASKRDYAGLDLQKPLKSGQNRVDFPLSAGALLEGRVVSAATGEPVKGQTLGLETPGENYQYEISDDAGRFRFRSVPGKLHFWVHANGTNSPPPGYILPAQNKFDFSLKEGQTKTFLIQLPDKAPTKPITGRVVGPDGAPVAGAKIELSGLGGDDFSRLNSPIRSDASGRFLIPAAKAAKPVRVFAAAGELQTARGVVALAGDDVTLKLESGVGVTFAGRVVDFDSKLPLAGAKVLLLQRRVGIWFPIKTIPSQSDGKFKFSNQRPRESYMVSAQLPGYELKMSNYSVLSGDGASRQQIRLTLRRASSFVGGRVVRANGQPAVGFRVRTNGLYAPHATDAKGRFTLPHTFSGPIEISVSTEKLSLPGRLDFWSQTVMAGRRDVVIRLDQARHDVIDRMPAMNQTMPKIGQLAPEIRAARWFNSAPLSLSSLRGQVVLLDFNSAPLNFGEGAPFDIEEVERAFSGRGLRVIGVQDDVIFDRRTDSKVTTSLQCSAAGTAFPVAVDASDATPPPARGAKYLVGATMRSYGLKSRVVIDRAGRIAYIGNSLSDAVSIAAGLLAAK